MPEITLNFNINITCDPAILNFLKTLQGNIKPVETEKQVSIPSMWSPPFVSSTEPVITTSSEAIIPQKPPVIHRKEKNKYKEVAKKGFPPHVSLTQIKEKLFSFVAKRGITSLPYSSGISSSEGREIRETLYEHLGTKANLSIKLGIEELVKEGKLIKTADTKVKNGRSFVYSLPVLSELKANNEKALEVFKQQIIEEEEEEEEDVLRADTRINVPSPERRPRREIKRKCLKCGGQLWKRNTAEDNYLDSESRFIDNLEEVYYQCFQCGSIFKEKEFKEEAKAA